MARSLAPISSIAWSQLRRIHWPLTSFIGYFSRRSLCTSSRTEAPLAQCDPRLIGESQLGSWPTHTPFSTSAVTVHPTAQCVQMLLRTVAPAESGPATAASALRTLPTGSVLSAARAPPATPERRRNARRSRPPVCPARASATELRRPEPERWFCVLLISTAASLQPG